ncbi:MAG: 1-deoxy-D-xylulose-5-phosphate reductoisomerase [Chlorobi bacterium]|nr:1-deoxy-D-xylulose-5-phosphate reductoisomerase [Chlorobiota bacterium]
MKKKISILGSTGSIGTQALDVIRSFPDHFEVTVLAAGTNAGLLIKQALEWGPKIVVIADKTRYKEVQTALHTHGIEVRCGEEGLIEAARYPSADMVLVSLVGFAALTPTIEAIRARKDIALASKEVMVVAGGMVTRLAEEKNIRILPVDSEHSAIFQCLEGESKQQVEKIYLTASGGPFLRYHPNEMECISPEAALKHPNWKMGNKITIDSASMMNKGLEVIEAKWLFGLDPDQIDVVIHPQSIVHSLVQFRDGALKAQLGTPDMRLPILYAFSWPQRLSASWPRFDFADYPSLTFEKADQKKFRNLALSFQALRKGGNIPCVLNAANEVVVQAFLEKQLDFMKMPDVIEQTMERSVYIANPDLQELRQCDLEARLIASEYI